jgi:hypothetical protein
MKTVQEYISSIAEDKKEAFLMLKEVISKNLSTEFEETIAYNMITYVIPFSVYPDGYHCNPEQALPFISIAAQKNFIALYHMGVYAKPELAEWLVQEYPKHAKYKLDMGKSCIRFKKMSDIPFSLIGELIRKMSAQEWISIYEANIRKK